MKNVSYKYYVLFFFYIIALNFVPFADELQVHLTGTRSSDLLPKEDRVAGLRKGSMPGKVFCNRKARVYLTY